MAFLDINPIRPGHSQIIPKTHHAYFEELPADLMGKITAVAQRIARTQKNIYGVERVGFAFTGGDVPHAHAHIVPLVNFDDLTSRRYIVEDLVTYRNPPRPSDDDMRSIAEALRQNLQK